MKRCEQYMHTNQILPIMSFIRYVRGFLFGWVSRRTNTVKVILRLFNFTGGRPLVHYFRHELARQLPHNVTMCEVLDPQIIYVIILKKHPLL